VTVLVSQKIISEADGKKVTDVTETVEEKAGSALDAVVASKEGEQTFENPVAAAAAVALQIREVASTESSTQESKE
jgi:hypothetical protein